MPPATWRKWYPHIVEKWNSSPAIQMLSDSAYRAYHSLIMAQWESEDGYLPENERLLQTLARVREESRWKEIRDEIFSLLSMENGHLFSRTQREEWLRAKAVSDKKGRRCPECGKTLKGKRCACGHNNNNNNSIKKPSRVKREADSRNKTFKEVCTRYYEYHHFEMTWGPAEGKQMANLLAANPALTVEQFRVFLGNRTKSEAVNHAERPCVWLANVTKYASGPLDKFNKPLSASPDAPAFKPVTLAEKFERQTAQA